MLECAFGSTSNIPANTGPNGDPIATPSVCVNVSPQKIKWTPFV